MKLKIILNVLLHHHKYKKLLGCKVKIKPECRRNGNQEGVVTGFEFYNFKKYLIVTFFYGDEKTIDLCYEPKEIELK